MTNLDYDYNSNPAFIKGQIRYGIFYSPQLFEYTGSYVIIEFLVR